MTFPMPNKNGNYAISHMQHLISAHEEDLNGSLRNYLRPIQWNCGGGEEESRKFFYFPLTSFYQSGENMDNMGTIPLTEIYDDDFLLRPNVTRNIKRVMLRYNLSINISFPEANSDNFVNIFYIQSDAESHEPNQNEFFNSQFRNLSYNDDALMR